jgi:hypothetical protein
MPPLMRVRKTWIRLPNFNLLVVLCVSAGFYGAPEAAWSASGDDAKQHLRTAAESSGSEEVDALVKKLVSERPPLYPDGYWPAPFEFYSGYETPEVRHAKALLKQRGPSIFPQLIQHLHDDRYCYSGIVQAVANYTVGEVILDLVCDSEDSGPVYMEGRASLTGRCEFLTFSQYIKEKKDSQWAEWAKSKTRLQIQLDFIDWCVATEEKRGFVDAEQRAKLLLRYEEKRERMKRKYPVVSFNKVADSDLIVAGRIDNMAGLGFQGVEIKDQEILQSTNVASKTLLVRMRPGELVMRADQNTKWIFFLRKAFETSDRYEYCTLVGGEDYEGMVVATDENVERVKEILKTRRP